MRRPQASVNRRDVNRRDAGLARLNRLTRWIAAGAVALVGIFSAVLAHALPGRSAGASSPAQTSGNTGPATGTGSTGTGSTGAVTPATTTAPNLQPPAQAPAPVQVPRRSHVTSGGS